MSDDDESKDVRWSEVESTQYQREWLHRDGHRIEVEELITEHKHPEEYTKVDYAVRLVVADEDEFVIGGVAEDSLEKATEIANSILEM